MVVRDRRRAGAAEISLGMDPPLVGIEGAQQSQGPGRVLAQMLARLELVSEWAKDFLNGVMSKCMVMARRKLDTHFRF